MGSNEEKSGSPGRDDNSEAIAVKVKLEKVDPEIEEKIKAITLHVKQEQECVELNEQTPQEEENDSDFSSNSTEEDKTELDDKKSIEPVKSSNEILAELFKVFNAAPPEEILDDKNLLKKSHKHKKHKEKKKKHKKDKTDAEALNNEINKSLEKSKHKKKKKHKHKTTQEKDRVMLKDKDKEIERDNARDKLARRSKDRDESKEKQLRSKEKSRDRDHDKERDRARDREKSKERERKKTPIENTHGARIKVESEEDHHRRDRNFRKRYAEDYDTVASLSKSRRSNNNYKIERESTNWYSLGHKDHEPQGHISEISLSDEESYLQERERRTNEPDRRRFEHDRSHSKGTRSLVGSHCNAERNRYGTSNYRSVGRHQRRSPSRTRSSSRPRSLGIDKKRLLEIARKNVISMFKRGNLPGCTEMSEEIKDKVLLKMRYGGRTVQDLTDFCKKISNGEHPSDLSSDEESDVDKNGNTKAFHHPFQVKEREPIVMHIHNAKPIMPRRTTEDQTKAITMQFPVSSGQQHRLTEAWVPVETKESLAPLPSLPAATQATNIFKATIAPKSVAKNVFEKLMPPQEEQQPAFKPVGGAPPAIEAAIAIPNSPATNYSATALQPMPMPVPSPSFAPSEMASVLIGSNVAPAQSTFVPDTAVPSIGDSHASKDTVFRQGPAISLDVSSIISKRLSAMRRLQENPMDSEAIKMMYNSQRDMSSWASSKHLPGQFTGSTGVNVLKVHELNSGPQVWARRDQLTSSKPVTGGMGMHLLQKMGWKPGEGLGREKTGSLQPLLLDVKLDKRGLVAKEDTNQQQRRSVVQSKKQRPSSISQTQQNMQEKHPVCLLNELTSKRKWTPPLYSLVNEVGPSHSKMFMFSVSINGETFTPNQASNTKKEAKLVAARHCLKQIGVLP